MRRKTTAFVKTCDVFLDIKFIWSSFEDIENMHVGDVTMPNG